MVEAGGQVTARLNHIQTKDKNREDKRYGVVAGLGGRPEVCLRDVGVFERVSYLRQNVAQPLLACLISRPTVSRIVESWILAISGRHLPRLGEPVWSPSPRLDGQAVSQGRAGEDCPPGSARNTPQAG